MEVAAVDPVASMGIIASRVRAPVMAHCVVSCRHREALRLPARRQLANGARPLEAGTIWTAATLPVVAALAISILRDFWIGRFGVDAIALVSMSAALLLGQALAAVVVAIMYAGGTVLEDFARGRAERNLKALTDRSPRVAHRKSAHGTETIPVEEVAVGDELLVRAGELLPSMASFLMLRPLSTSPR